MSIATEFLPRLGLLASFLQSRIRASNPDQVVYVGDQSDWVIRWIGEYLEENLKSQISIKRDTSSLFYASKVLHFGSAYSFSQRNPLSIDSSNKVITTMYHGDYGIDSAMDRSIDRIVSQMHRMDKMVLSNSIMHKRLLSWGFSPESLAIIPIGYRGDLFSVVPPSVKAEIRRKLNIPDHVILIGSFQKDGNGWGEGLEPKLIKGPDLFVETVVRLKKDFPVHCLLSGPSRGYVKQKLSESGVPFSHVYKDTAEEMPALYQALDLYIMSSREEGGPIALMESMATGTPLVSTKVGMAEDIIIDGENALLASTEVESLYQKSYSILSNIDLANKLKSGAPLSVKHLDWKSLSKEYLDLYLSLGVERKC